MSDLVISHADWQVSDQRIDYEPQLTFVLGAFWNLKNIAEGLSAGRVAVLDPGGRTVTVWRPIAGRQLAELIDSFGEIPTRAERQLEHGYGAYAREEDHE